MNTHKSTDVLIVSFALVLLMGLLPVQAQDAVTLRLMVSLTPDELASFTPAIDAVNEAHPEWDIQVELVPQGNYVEKVNTELAAGTLPDIVRGTTIGVLTWIDRGAFLDLQPFLDESALSVDDFFPGAMSSFIVDDGVWGISDTAAPDVIYYNIDMFDAAGLDYPTSDWTLDDMRETAIQLTLDEDGNTPADEDFDADNIVQWGWNTSIGHLWHNNFVQARGADWCLNELCTEMDFVSSQEAVQWWIDLIVVDHAAPSDPYSGAITGVPGDPFINGFAAMGATGSFAIGQLNTAGIFNYGIIEPLIGVDGNRFTPISVTGYMINADTDFPEEAWALVETLLDAEFLAETWGQPGHGVPALREAADSAINPQQQPEDQDVILRALEYARPFRPYGVDSFQAFGASVGQFVEMARGDISVEEALPAIQELVNEILLGE